MTLMPEPKRKERQEFEDLFDEVPLVLSSVQLEHVVHDVLRMWVEACPWEVAPALAKCREKRERLRNPKGMSETGELQAVFMMPAFVNDKMREILQSPHWMQTNPKALPILAAQFDVGRLGRVAASGGALTMTQADTY